MILLHVFVRQIVKALYPCIKFLRQESLLILLRMINNTFVFTLILLEIQLSSSTLLSLVG